MPNDFSVNLVKYRKRRGMTQGQLAALLSVTPQAVSKWEKGSYPDSELIPTIAKILGVSLDVLYGLSEEQEEADLAQMITAKIKQTDPKKRADVIMQLFYAAISAYNEYTLSKVDLPEKLELETFAELKTDEEIALVRLNRSLRYLCFLSIPPEGVNSYADASPNVVQLFRLLADEDALKIIYYLGSGMRNRIQSKEHIAQNIHIPLETVSRVVDRLDRLGLVWRMQAELPDEAPIVYSYGYSAPLTFILTLAKSLSNYLQFHDLYIDTWTHGAFRRPEQKTEPVPEVSGWNETDSSDGSA